MDASNFVEQNRLNFKQRNNFIHKLNELRNENLKLIKWLESKGLEKYVSGFYKLGYIDLESVQSKMLRFEIKDVISYMDGPFPDYQLLVEAVDDLKDGSQRWMIASALYFLFRAFLFVFKWLCKCHSYKSCVHYILTNQFPWVEILQTDCIIVVVFLSSFPVAFTWIRLLSRSSITIQCIVHFASSESIIFSVCYWLLPGSKVMSSRVVAER